MPSQHQQVETCGTRVVLAVDDDALILMGIKAMLQDQGYCVLTATSPEMVVDVLHRTDRNPDIVLSDYRLAHGRVGSEVINAVRAHLGCEVPGIILTGDSSPDLQHTCAALNVGIAYKPVNPRMLDNAIQKRLSAAAEFKALG